jgi:hypothetical protein
MKNTKFTKPIYFLYQTVNTWEINNQQHHLNIMFRLTRHTTMDIKNIKILTLLCFVVFLVLYITKILCFILNCFLTGFWRDLFGELRVLHLFTLLCLDFQNPTQTHIICSDSRCLTPLSTIFQLYRVDQFYLLVDETGLPGENHRPVENWQTTQIMLIQKQNTLSEGFNIKRRYQI